MRDLNCLVTGGAGFIGSNLVRHLLREGAHVTVIDDLSTGSWINLGDVAGDIRFFEADIRDRERTAPLFRGIDYVFHQAAQASVPRSIEDPWTCHDANVNGTLRVLLAARDAGVRRVVYAASSSAYGDAEVLPKVETMPAAPLSPYAVTKYVGELYCHVFHRVYGLETVALRYFNVFGPWQNPESQYAAVIPKFITALLRGQSPVIHGDGEQTRDFIYVENVVAANVRAALAPAQAAAGRVFNVGCGGRISLNDLLRELHQILETRVSQTHSTERTGDVHDSQADITAAREALGYQPSVELHEGLRRTAAWFVAQERVAADAWVREGAAA
jgi:nucleoside-diphosphate-sugar epimerase